MSEQPAMSAGRRPAGRLELVWRWMAFGVMPFAVALTTALAVTAYLDARGQANAGTPAAAPPGPQSAPTLARLMNLSPLPERPAPGFTLTDQHGRKVSLAGFRGKTVLLGFLDSRCTQVCPVIAQELIAADHDLGPRASGVAFVGVNVNPAAESVAAVEHFSVIHGLARLPNWYYLTGSTRQLARVWKAYGITVELPSGASQTIHADYLFFINPLGHERFLAGRVLAGAARAGGRDRRRPAPSSRRVPVHGRGGPGAARPAPGRVRLPRMARLMTAPEPESTGPGSADAVSGPAPARPRPGRAGRRWWLLAAAAVVAGAVLGVVIARAARPGGLNSTSAQVLPGGYFSRLHGPKAPPWQLPGLADPARTISLAQFRGHPLVINFWASWCPPCRKEMPALERAARALSGRVSFAGLDTQDERGAGLAFARRMGVTYPLATDNAQVYASYGVNGLPVTFFVSADGTLAGRQVGGLTQAGLNTIIRQVFGVTVGQP